MGKFYYKDGTSSNDLDPSKILHRTNGPAVEWANGTKVWYVDGKFHRTNGPAYEGISGHKAWGLDGISLTEKEFNEAIKNFKYSKNISQVGICTCDIKQLFSYGHDKNCVDYK